jgi:hypothetical protein
MQSLYVKFLRVGCHSMRRRSHDAAAAAAGPAAKLTCSAQCTSNGSMLVASDVLYSTTVEQTTCGGRRPTHLRG